MCLHTWGVEGVVEWAFVFLGFLLLQFAFALALALTFASGICVYNCMAAVASLLLHDEHLRHWILGGGLLCYWSRSGLLQALI